MSLDALKLADSVQRRLVDFGLSDHFVKDAGLREALRELWGTPGASGLTSELWVEGAFPPKQADETLRDLVNTGEFPGDLAGILQDAGAMPLDRRLYTHQVEAFRVANSDVSPRPAVAVSAGTGSGKTEAFLLPMLSHLWRTPAAGDGVQSILLYPMNALVNDQVDRLYSWLQGQSKISLFHFTSETPENKAAADRDNVPMWAPCRFRTRQQARGLETPDGRPVDLSERSRGPQPDIVITNYSMLEYMLSRPQDSVFFGPGLRHIVLDEAHLYTGTLAAEITLLLRRLMMRCGVTAEEVSCYATSATLGGTDVNLSSFISTIFSKAQASVSLIPGEATQAPFDARPRPPSKACTAARVMERRLAEQPTVSFDRTGTTGQMVQIGDRQTIEDSLAVLVADEVAKSATKQHSEVGAALFAALRSSPIMRQLEHELWIKRHCRVDTLAASLFPGQEQAVPATVELLRVAAMARASAPDYPLIPHRLHLLVRAPDGLSTCLNPACGLPPYRTKYGHVVGGNRARCPNCEHVLLSLRRCDGCGEAFFAGMRDRTNLGLTVVPPAMSSANPRVSLYSIDPNHGTIKVAFSTKDGLLRHPSDPASVQIAAIEGSCPVCDEAVRGIRSFASGPALTLPIVAETALADLPPIPSPIATWLPAGGRRMLTFSDSRAEAARLGPRLTRQHETQIIRSALARLLAEGDGSDEDVPFFKDKLADVGRQLARPMSDRVRRLLETERAQLELVVAQATSGGAITDWTHKVSQHAVMAEILNEEAAERHVAAYYGQRDWETNEQANRERVLGLVAEEFIRWIPNATTNLEGLGLAEIVYPGLDRAEAPEDLIGRLPTKKLRDGIRRVWPQLIAALLDSVRGEGAITTGVDVADLAFSERRAPIGRWLSANDEWGRDLAAFIGKTERHRRTRFMEQVLRQLDGSAAVRSEVAIDVLAEIFRQLHQSAHPVGEHAQSGQLAWLECSDRQTEAGPAQPAIRIRFPQLALRLPTTLYRCEVTGTVWPRSVAGCAPFPGVAGTLQPCTHESCDEDLRIGRRRREYLQSEVFQMGLWAEEHSAQLSPKENRRLQDLFKAGIRNILSSTTTLELGIDIGGLNAVLLSNVPPGKASYLQRAGRAGRRADGSSVVITFARPRPFDRAAYRDFDTYLSRELRTPVVLLNRERIALRHLGAYLLGRFFREIYPEGTHVGAMDAFGRMGSFCGLMLPQRWDAGNAPPPLPREPQSLSSRLRSAPWGVLKDEFGLEGHFLDFLFWLRDWAPDDWRRDVRTLFEATPIEETAQSHWGPLIEHQVDAFGDAIVEWRRTYDVLFRAWASAENHRQANAIRYQLLALHNTTVIEALSDNQYLPRYGFPVGLMKLRVIRPDEDRPGRIREEDQFRLERSGIMAMREYVPGSEFIVGGKLVTSRGILKHWSGAEMDTAMGLRGRAAFCDQDHFYYTVSGILPRDCPTCRDPLANGPHDLLFPAFGFSTAAWDSPRRGTSSEFIGETTVDSLAFGRRGGGQADDAVWHNDFAGISGLVVAYQENGELLVHNRGEGGKGFAICTLCGYADSERKVGQGTMDLPSGFDKHAPLSSANRKRSCWSTTSGVMRNQWLAAREPTDLLLLNFHAIVPESATDSATVLTVALALSRAAAELNDLDPRELGVLTVPTGSALGSRGALIYDSVPGGAGHVQAAMQMGRRWLEAARQSLYVDAAHNSRCDTACLDCVLEFDVNASSEESLDRRAALQTLDRILGGGIASATNDASGIAATSASDPAPAKDPPIRPSKSERLGRARQRRGLRGPASGGDGTGAAEAP